VIAALGIVAGNGVLPLECARSAKEMGRSVIVVGHYGETSKEIKTVCDEFYWVHVGQLKKILRYFSGSGVNEVIFAGGIRRVPMSSLYRLDALALRLLFHARSVKDDALLKSIARLFESRGMVVGNPSAFVPHLVAKEGLYTSRDLSSQELDDARLGWQAAEALGALDIGQSSAVSHGVVVALEALEGTDRMVRRCKELAPLGFIVVKRSKPQQDLRLDLPTIGPDTIRILAESGGTSLVLEAGKSFILEPTTVVTLANASGIAFRVFSHL
jgi:UDP-2,3-diacylglucosamine hydrolase